MKFADRVKETTTTTGTGNITLAGAPTGFETFSANFASAEVFFYAIVGQSSGEWEVGLGSLSAGALVRTTVYQSSNADAAVNFSAGIKDVFVTIPGGWANGVMTRGQAVAAIAGNAMP